VIRRAEQNDIQPLAELWARAFPGERTVEQRVRHLETGGVFGGIDTAWVTVREGRIVGAFRGYSLTQHMHGTAWRMLGLAAVAVDETVRRSGLGRELCVNAIRIGRERGDVFSVLYPFRPDFYHSLGWGYVGEMYAFRFRPESLSAKPTIGTVRRATPDDIAAIAACYTRVARESNGLITRTSRIWRSHLEGDGTHVYVTGTRGINGYTIVNYGRAPSPDDRPLHVREIVAEDQHNYDTLVAWLASQRDTWRIIQYDASRDERFDLRLVEPRPPGFRTARYLWTPVARVIRGPMLRVLDVQAALEQRAQWRSGTPIRFTLSVTDDMVPENKGPFVVDFNGDRVSVERGSEQGLALRCTAPVFAQIYAGELTVSEGMSLGGAEATGDVSSIDALFRTTRCFRLLDEF
jgi:predicted acetyltransferase